jgi:hypothetical protein
MCAIRTRRILRLGCGCPHILCRKGRLLAGSLHVVEQSPPGIQLSLAKVGIVIGEAGMTNTALGLTIGAESRIFILAIGIKRFGCPRSNYGARLKPASDGSRKQTFHLKLVSSDAHAQGLFLEAIWRL